MNYIFLFTLLIVQINLFAQQENPKTTIDNFFKAFHEKDTASLSRFLVEEMTFHTIYGKGSDNKLLITERTEFLSSLPKIPDNVNFREEIISYDEDIDGDIARVSTPYSFYMNDKEIHSGINYFTLIKTNGLWRIVHLVDTRITKN
ncbi:MAG: nuclear transport factor 2 family protein [Brumimicrobium sp.]|nr:nuclear transport factor 2 family protein [Brumimicrobium sp.]